MKRAIILTLLVLLSVGVLVPLTTNLSEASRTKIQKRKKFKKHSRAWWRAYHARQRRSRRAAARRRALMAQRPRVSPHIVKAQIVPVVESKAALNAPVMGWTGESVTPNGEATFRVNDQNGVQIGSAQLAVVGAAQPEPAYEIPKRMREKLLGGVSTANFRRAVIDRMVREEGWIVNDYSQEIAGKKVFVIIGQTAKGGAVNSRLFYFTEVDGAIYSLSTTAPENYSDRIAADSEQFLQKLQRGNRSQEVTAATSLQ